MALILSTILIIIIGISLERSKYWLYSGVVAGSGILLLLFLLMALILSKVQDSDNMHDYYKVKEHVEAIRGSKCGSNDTIERSIVIQNDRLLRAKRLNEGIFDIFVVDEYANLDLLR